MDFLVGGVDADLQNFDQYAMSVGNLFKRGLRNVFEVDAVRLARIDSNRFHQHASLSTSQQWDSLTKVHNLPADPENCEEPIR